MTEPKKSKDVWPLEPIDGSPEDKEPTIFEQLYLWEMDISNALSIPRHLLLDPAMFQTTAIYPNRVADKERVERLTGLQEEGNPWTTFLDRRVKVFATGYNRVVYGDHGPYVEFELRNIEATLNKLVSGPPKEGSYYEWITVFGDPNIKVYRQLRTVANLPNPPRGGFKGNRKEGYADYRVGMFYVSVGDFTKIVNR